MRKPPAVLIRCVLLTPLTLLLLLSLGGLGALGASGSSAVAAPAWQPPLHPMRVTRPFELPPTPYAAGHRGVDLAGQAGQVVLAAAAGAVAFAGPLAGRGVVVVVHGSLRTTYEPVQPLVRRGTQVAGGEQIGTLIAGHAGCPVAACLHWGLLRGEVYLDPMVLISPRAFRLFPPAEIVGQAARQGIVDGRVAATGGGAPLPAALPSAEFSVLPGPSPATWSLVAVSGAGALVALRRRR